MNQIALALSFVGQMLALHRAVPVQFVEGEIGRNVTVCIDGTVETTFAGKLAFRDQNSSWMSVCADVRSPIQASQVFRVIPRNTLSMGGNIRRAGNIVAKYFKTARTPDECAGLQLAVWKVLEDGPASPDFSQGHFQARADLIVMMYAQQYSQAVDEDGSALYLQVAGEGSGGGDPSGQGGQGQMSG